MDPYKILSAFAEWTETLPDHPFMLLLFIMGLSLVISAFGMLIQKLVIKLADLTMDADELEKIGAMAYGGDEDGKIDGIQARFMTNPITNRSGDILGYEAQFKYTVANPRGIKLLIHRAGLLNTPIGILPPKVPAVPERLKAAGYTLRCSPPELAAETAQKAAAFGVFAEGKALNELTLSGNEVKAALEADEDWPDEELTRLLKAGAAAARSFN